MVTWIIGLSGAGKTTIGNIVFKSLKKKYTNLVFLDGDDFRHILGDDLGHSLEDRKKNADRFCRMCKYFDDQGIHVIAAILSIFPDSREWNKINYNNYYEIYIDTPIKTLIKRDTKGLYKKALSGEIKDVAGVDLHFTPPTNPDCHIINDGKASINQIAIKLIELLEKRL